MTIIKDIRIYRSTTENITGNSFPYSFGNKKLNCILHRITMKLREKGFTLGDFDHLYINITTCAVEEKISPAKRDRDKYHPFYRYYDVEVGQDFFDLLETPQCIKPVVEIVEQVLQKYFVTTDFSAEYIHTCVSEAAVQGEKMIMKFKEKRTSKNKAVIYLRYLDNAHYYPLLRVFDLEDNLLLEKDLPETDHLDAYGEIQLSMKKVTVKPRKNCFSDSLEPMSFML